MVCLWQVQLEPCKTLLVSRITFVTEQTARLCLIYLQVYRARHVCTNN